MADAEHRAKIKEGVKTWNTWRDEHPQVRPDLLGADLRRVNLIGANLCRANLIEADFFGANLSGTNLSRANLSKSNLRGADLFKTDLFEANLRGANLTKASLIEVNLRGADLTKGDLFGINLTGADLGKADLRRANLSGADLFEANLSEAILFGANLRRADLRRANLSGADLSRANLFGANLCGTNLTEANLFEADLSRANLEDLNLEKTFLGETTWADVDLSKVVGLDTCRHLSPSPIDHRTLAESSPLPDAFLRGCGLSNWQIEETKLFQQDLTNVQINDIIHRIYNLRTASPIQSYSCFISYSDRDETFATQLFDRLQRAGVRCWFAPEELKTGEKFNGTIDQSIQIHDKLLLILSKNSIHSSWVKEEAHRSVEKGNEIKRPVFFPIYLDDSVMDVLKGWPAMNHLTNHSGDFTRWRSGSEDHFEEPFKKLLEDLQTEK